MFIKIIASSLIKNNSNFYNLAEDYKKRFSLLKVNILDFEDKKLTQETINKKIFTLTPPTSYKILLDEKGKEFTTMELKDFLGNIEQKEISFLIAGADGFLPEYKQKADCIISLSKLTLPHQMARILLLEQLYRIQSILTNHPYHRV